MNSTPVNEASALQEPSSVPIAPTALEVRLNQVDSSNRCLKLGIFFLSAAFLAITGWGARTLRQQAQAIGALETSISRSSAVIQQEVQKAFTSRNGETIETPRLVIKDPAGKIRYQIGISAENQPEQTFYDQSGTARIITRIRASGNAGQNIADTNGIIRIASVATADGDARHSLFDTAERLRVATLVDKAGSSFLMVNDTNETYRVALGLNPNGTVLHQLRDKSSVRFDQVVSAEGTSSQTIYDSKGKRRSGINVYPDGLANQILWDSQGQTRLISYIATNGAAGQSIMDHAGNERVHLASRQGRSLIALRDGKGTSRSEWSTTDSGHVAQVFNAPSGVAKIATAVDSLGKPLIPAPEESDFDKVMRWGNNIMTIYDIYQMLSKD